MPSSPEDRFRDLNPDDDRSAAGRLAELDETGPPEPEPERPAPPRPRNPYTWVVGVAFLIALVVAGVNSLPNSGRGFRGPTVGERLPSFAAPLATGRLEGDANVKQETGEGGSNRTPACDVRGPEVLNICELRARRPLVLTMIVAGRQPCEAQLDLIERVRKDFPQVAFAGVVSGVKHKTVADLVRRHGWRFPVAVDRDLAVFSLYRLGDCPSTVFAHRGGEVQSTRINRPMSEAAVRAAVRTLARGARDGRR